jgi:hypothetical protein
VLTSVEDGPDVSLGEGPCGEYLLGRQCDMELRKRANRARRLSLVGLDWEDATRLAGSVRMLTEPRRRPIVCAEAWIADVLALAGSLLDAGQRSIDFDRRLFELDSFAERCCSRRFPLSGLELEAGM